MRKEDGKAGRTAAGKPATATAKQKHWPSGAKGKVNLSGTGAGLLAGSTTSEYAQVAPVARTTLTPGAHLAASVVSSSPRDRATSLA